MKYKIQFLVLAILLSGVVNRVGAQSNYYDVPVSSKQNLFLDEMNDNSNGWWTGDSYRTVSFEYGYMVFEAKGNDEAGSHWRPFTFAESSDFEIETSIRYVSGEDNNFDGLIWGRGTNGNFFRFGFAPNGYYRADKYEDQSWKTYTDWVESSVVKKDSWNKLTVRKMSGTLYLFLNETMIYSRAFEPFFDNKIGFTVNSNSKINIDYLSISLIQGGSYSSSPNLSYNQPAAQGDPTTYNGMAGASRKSVYDNQMDNDRDSWTQKDGDYEIYFESGYMTFISRCATPGAKWINQYIDQSKDFEIEAKYRFVSGEDNNFIGLGFGAQNPGNKWRFGFTANGNYTVDKRYNDAWIDIVPWTFSSLIKKYDWNKITVRKVGNTLYYFLNEGMVYTKPFEPFFGDKVGLYTNSNTTVNVDYLKIDMLEGGVVVSAGKSLYDNQFDTDKEGWYQNDSEFDIHFENGYMYFQSKCSSPGAKWVNLVIDQSQDFEIETRYRFVNGEDNNFIGLGFGAQNPGNKWRFGFTGDGHYTVDKRYNNEWVDIVPWTVTTLVSKYDWNTLTVRKSGSTLYYLLNGQQVYTKPFEPFFGDKVGVYTNSMTTVNIDYLRVNQGGGAPAVASKKVLYDNQFDSDKDGWYQNDSEFDIHFESGYMYFQSKCSSTGAKWVNVFIDQSKDFEIETRCRFVNGEDNNFIGLGFGAQHPGSKWRFGFTGNGNYTIDKRYNDQWIDIVPWTVSTLISKYDWNTLLIRKTGSTLYYLLNGQQVYTKPFEPFFGDKIGLYTNSMTTVNFDYLTVSELGTGSGYVANNNYQNNYNQNNFVQNNVVQNNVAKPVITWINPTANGTSSATADFVIRVKVTSTAALSSSLIFVNGFPQTQLTPTTVGSDLYFEKQITLSSGNNLIEFKATNDGGEGSDTRNITYTVAFNPQVQQQMYSGSQQVGIPQSAGFRQQGSQQQQTVLVKSEVDDNIPVNEKVSSRFALIIGNEDYASYQRSLGSESNVEFAVNDATIFKEYCIKTLGLEERNVFFLTNATAGVMSQNIELITKIASKLSGTCEIIFYYAGHGLPDEVTHAPYLIPVDVNAANLAAAIKLNDIYAKFSQCGAKRITVFLDACFSGGGRSAGLLSARSVKVKPKVDVPTGSLVVFTASSGDQSSLPYKEKGHGMFTYFLLKKLQDSQGKVTYGELSKFLKENVSVESLRTNFKEQDPQVNVSPALQGLWDKYTFVK